MGTKQDIREAFRNAVFTRDKNKCVVPNCNKPPVDAHHIIERALWLDETELGGYIPDNGASVCELHHRHAEANFIPPQALRQWAGITRRVLPKQLDTQIVYDKWGKPLGFPNRELVKYPHTPYFNFSPGSDKLDVDECGFINNGKLYNKPLVLTIKMDGSNVKMTNDIVTARNGHSADHKSFDYIKSQHAGFKHLIPPNINVFAEWLYAKHSIHYIGDNALDSLIQVFGVYDYRTQLWYGWEDVVKLADAIGLKTVPVISFRAFESKNTDGTDGWDWQFIHEITRIGNDVIKHGHEGVVVRSWYPFQWSQFRDNVGKYVRAGHVQTDKHWSSQKIVKNECRGN